LFYFINNFFFFFVIFLKKNSNRSKPLNVGESIRACLIRLMTNTLLGNSRETISTLLYTLCDSNGNYILKKNKIT